MNVSATITREVAREIRTDYILLKGRIVELEKDG